MVYGNPQFFQRRQNWRMNLMLDDKSLEGLPPELRLVACKIDDLFTQLDEEGPTLNVLTQIERWSSMAGIVLPVQRMIDLHLGLDSKMVNML
jgi:hypothetical protein